MWDRLQQMCCIPYQAIYSKDLHPTSIKKKNYTNAEPHISILFLPTSSLTPTTNQPNTQDQLTIAHPSGSIRH